MRTEEEIRALKAVVKKAWDRPHSLFEELENYYNMLFPVTVWGEDNERIRPGTAKSLVDYAVDQIITDNPSVTCDPPNDTEKGQAGADLSEKFGQRFWYHLDRTRQIPVARQWAKSGISFDIFVVKGPLFLPERLSAKPTRNKGERKVDYEERLEAWGAQVADSFPFLVSDVHPVNFYPEVSDEQPTYAFEIGKTTVGQAKAMCKDLGIKWDGAGGEDDEDIEWSEFWSAKEFAYFAGDILVGKVRENPYGWLPYRVGTAGFGQPTSDQDLSKRYQGLLAPARDILRMEASCLSALKARFEREGYGSRITSNKPVDGLKDPGPAGIAQLPEGVELKLWPQAPMDTDTYRLYEITQVQIEGATYSRTLKGIFPAQGTSGYRERLSIGQSSSKFKTLLRQLEICSASILRRAVWVAKHNIQEPLFEERFDPKKLLDRPNFKVKLEPVDPQEQYNRIEQGIKQRNAGVLDIWTYMQEYAGRPDASEGIKALFREKVLFSQPVLAAMMQAAAAKWGIEEAIKQLETAVAGQPTPQLAPGQAPPAQLPPGIPPAPAAAGSMEQMQQLIQRMGNNGAPIGGQP